MRNQKSRTSLVEIPSKTLEISYAEYPSDLPLGQCCDLANVRYSDILLYLIILSSWLKVLVTLLIYLDKYFVRTSCSNSGLKDIHRKR